MELVGLQKALGPFTRDRRLIALECRACEELVEVRQPPTVLLLEVHYFLLFQNGQLIPARSMSPLIEV